MLCQGPTPSNESWSLGRPTDPQPHSTPPHLQHTYHVCHVLQDWLTSIEIKYYESKVNLNWKNILKSIKEVGDRATEGSGHVFLPVLVGVAEKLAWSAQLAPVVLYSLAVGPRGLH